MRQMLAVTDLFLPDQMLACDLLTVYLLGCLHHVRSFLIELVAGEYSRRLYK
jgi:hypothetical protein